jgi:hypothetical protein
MDGSHSIESCEEITGLVLRAVFNTLFDQRVSLESMLLKPNMVIAGKECARQASVEEVSTATLRCLRRHLPAALPGIVFLSGGQKPRLATAHLNAINRLPSLKPWKVVSPTDEHFRIRRWRNGMGGMEIWQPASGLLTAGRALTERRLSGNILMRWRRHPSAPMIHRIAVTGATTNAHTARRCNAQFDEIGFRGGDDGKHAV